MSEKKQHSELLQKGQGMVDRTVADVEMGKSFYKGLFADLDTGPFGSLWHLVTIAHLVMGDLELIARRHGLGVADLFALGTLRIARAQPYRATDLANTLFVTKAAITGRISFLLRRQLLRREADQQDRRAMRLQLTAKGEELIASAVRDIATSAQFSVAYQQLPAEDQKHLEEVLLKLHVELHRFYPGG